MELFSGGQKNFGLGKYKMAQNNIKEKKKAPLWQLMMSPDRRTILPEKLRFSNVSKMSTFWKGNKTKCCDNRATQIYPSHPGDRITCSPLPSVTQLGGGCLKAVTLTHSSILPNHPPTVPHSRRGSGGQTEGEAVNKRRRAMGWRRKRMWEEATRRGGGVKRQTLWMMMKKVDYKRFQQLIKNVLWVILKVGVFFLLPIDVGRVRAPWCGGTVQPSTSEDLTKQQHLSF